MPWKSQYEFSGHASSPLRKIYRYFIFQKPFIQFLSTQIYLPLHEYDRNHFTIPEIHPKCEQLFMFLKYFQLPCRTGPQTTHSRVNEEQIKVCLIQISRYRFSLVIAGLTKILQKINEMVSISVHCSSIYSRGCAST